MFYLVRGDINTAFGGQPRDFSPELFGRDPPQTLRKVHVVANARSKRIQSVSGHTDSDRLHHGEDWRAGKVLIVVGSRRC